MTKQLIVVVHGVGVRDAGVVTGQLSAALGGDLSPERAAVEQPWRPHSTDDFFLHEDERFAQGALLSIFPAHLRRFRRYDSADPTKVRQERVIADYFWGDISGTGLGLFRTLFGLIKIVLGLSHAIRENAMDVFPGASSRAVWMRRLARVAALIIHGPIAAINIVLIAGLVLTLVVHGLNGRGLPVPDRHSVAIPLPEMAPLVFQSVLGLGAVSVGWLGLRRAQVFLLRHLLSWLVAIGAMVLGVVALQAIAPDVVEGMMHLAGPIVFAGACRPLGSTCTLATTGFVVPGLVLMGTMMLAWAVTILSAMVIQIAAWGKGWFPERGSVPPLVQQAIALMTILWFVMMVAFWSLILLIHWVVQETRGFTLPEGLDITMVHASLRLVTPAIFALVVLSAVGLALHVRKGAAFDKMPIHDYFRHRDDLAERHRLIVGRALLVVLTLFTATMVVMGLVANVTGCRVLPSLTCSDILAWNDGLIPSLIAAVGGIAILLAIVGRRGLVTGVAIFTDVLVYLNDYSWRSREMGSQAKTLTEHALRMRRGIETKRQGYWLRDRIHSRMQVLMETLIRDETPDEIVIVSHSQGTMIALDVIEAQGEKWMKCLPQGAALKLVTMGSPYIHIYNTYFPSLFADLRSRPTLQHRDAGGLLTDWVNIFRVDDFVGTHIDTRRHEGVPNAGTGWPREVPVPRGGHTNYWIDMNVMPSLLRTLTF